MGYLPIYLMKLAVHLMLFAVHFTSGPCKALHSIIAPKDLAKM